MSSDTQKITELNDETDIEVTGVSDRLHEQSFDELLSVAQTIPEDERTVINWYAPDPKFTSATIRYLAKNLEVSFNLITQTALIHGFSIFQHKYSETLDLISGLDDAAVLGGNNKYFRHSGYRPIISEDAKRIPVRTDHPTSEALGDVAARLNTSRSHVAGVCILLSLSTSLALPDTATEKFAEHIAFFEVGLEMKQNINLKLS